jgi:hypothetical protein
MAYIPRERYTIWHTYQECQLTLHVISMFLLQVLHETGMPDLYPFIGLIILHVIISGSSLILHKVFDKQEI